MIGGHLWGLECHVGDEHQVAVGHAVALQFGYVVQQCLAECRVVAHHAVGSAVVLCCIVRRACHESDVSRV